MSKGNMLHILRRFVPPYRGLMVLNILFNLLSTVLSLFSFAAIIPVLRILFGLTSVDVQRVDLAAVSGLQETIAALRTNMYCLLNDQIAVHGASVVLLWLGLFLVLAIIRKRELDSSIFCAYLNTAYIFQALVLAGIPGVMVSQAFRLKEKKNGFLMSRGKEPPLLLHLIEYTTSDNVVEGVVHSLLFVYGRLFLYMLPTTVIACILTAFIAPWALAFAFILLLASMLIPLFVLTQGHCVRLDTLLVFLFAAGTIVLDCRDLIRDHNDGIRFFGIFAVTPAVWAMCMAYLPLAAADTFEYGLGKNARRIRLLQLGFVLTGFLTYLVRTLILDQESGGSSGADECAIWGFLGVVGLLASSIAPASFRARNSFRMRFRDAKNKLFFRFFDPSSPASILPVCLLEIAVLVLFFVVAKDLDPAGFWKDESRESGGKLFLQYVMLTFSALHFSLVSVQSIRRRSRQEKQAWRTHPLFNSMFGIFLAAGLLPAGIFSEGILNPFITSGYFIVSCLSLLLPAIREEREIGRDGGTLAEDGAEGDVA